jgi:hypothetical protein
MLKFTVRISIRHPTISPDEITFELGLNPHTYWCAGDVRKTPKGTPLKGVYMDNMWNHVFEYVGDKSFYKKTSDIICMLECKKDFIDKINSTGGLVSICIHLPGCFNIGDVMPWQFLMRMANLKIDLSTEVFPDWKGQST